MHEVSSNTPRTILLFGGVGSERLVSVATAQHVSTVIPRARHWFLHTDQAVYEIDHLCLHAHEHPFTQQLVPQVNAPNWPSLDMAIKSLDAEQDKIFIALHGEDGESGRLQKFLREKGVAFTGSYAHASALAYDKTLARRLAQSLGIAVAEAIEVEKSSGLSRNLLLELLERWGGIVIKPRSGGSSIDLHVLRSRESVEAYAACAHQVDRCIVEQLIAGREFTIGVIERGARSDPIALPASEVITVDARVFDYAGKYLSSGTTEVTPAQISADEYELLADVAQRMHRAAGCRGYTRTDIIMSDAHPVFLEINTLPGLTRQSFIPQQLRAAKIPFASFIEEQLSAVEDKV